MEGNAGFHEAENSTVHGHVIVLLDGEYIDLSLDQFEEYKDYIPVESGGQLGELLGNNADEVLATNLEWQALEREAVPLIASAKEMFASDSTTLSRYKPDVK